MNEVNPKVITFLVGFYVSTIVRRWWEQIKYLPLPVATNIQLANIIEDKNVSPDEALDLKKKIMRYFHLRSLIERYFFIVKKIKFSSLSWTLVMSQRNSEWYRRYEDGSYYISKGLMTPEEEQYMKVQTSLVPLYRCLILPRVRLRKRVARILFRPCGLFQSTGPVS